MILRCTQKFLTELRLKKVDLIAFPQVQHPLDEWYAHAFTIYPRRKCAIFMHAQTKFCFYAFDKTRDQLNDIKELFRKKLGRALFDEYYSAPVIKLFNERQETMEIGPATDRRILGFINHRIRDVQLRTDYDFDDPRETNEVLRGLEARRRPMLSEKKPFYYAIEQMRDLLLSCPELNGVEIAPADSKHPALEELYKARHARAHAAGYI